MGEVPRERSGGPQERAAAGRWEQAAGGGQPRGPPAVEGGPEQGSLLVKRANRANVEAWLVVNAVQV